jgi:hypothetical protein
MLVMALVMVLVMVLVLFEDLFAESQIDLVSWQWQSQSQAGKITNTKY